jgi:hypothetical protein
LCGNFGWRSVPRSKPGRRGRKILRGAADAGALTLVMKSLSQ